jgi:two-component system, NarL family, sensor histidine kinase UhpB
MAYGSSRRQPLGVALYRRVVAINTGLLIVAALVLAFSPATVSRNMTSEEWIVLALGTALAVVVNVLLLRRVFEPLEGLQAVMRRVDPHAPGRRVGIDESHVEEVAAVARALNDMLDRLESERAASGRRALAAQEAERRRVARELHDEVGQLLTSVVLQLEGVSRMAPPRLRGDLVDVQETAREGVVAVREIARGLRPPALDEFGLRAALVALAEGFMERTGLPVRHEIAGRLPELDGDAELAVYRVAQEALTNAARHASASIVELSLTRANGAVRLSVCDDGAGISAGRLNDGGGVAGMRERALLIGGSLHIGLRDERGTEVVLEVPG